MIPVAIQPVVTLPDLRSLVLNAVSSPITKALYRKALDDFFLWWEGQGRPPFQRAAVQAHRAHLELKGYSPSTINQRLAALKRLAGEAAANGWLAAEAAAAIRDVSGIPQRGARAGNWLTRAQAQALLDAPDTTTTKGRRDRALLALLLGCALRRAEAIALTVAHLQQRDGRPVIIDLRGKHGRVRTVPVPLWVEQAVTDWRTLAGITEGPILRAVNRHGSVSPNALSPQAVLQLVACYGRQIGVTLQAHDTRRTCAKLCRTAGGDLEQIQLLLGHASILTTERYLGTRQNLSDAPNDRIGLS
jgi:site-specific recombinase XerD